MKLFPSSVRFLIFLLILIFSPKSDGNAIPNSKSEDLQFDEDRMKSIMNLNVDPCDNFFEFACGSYEYEFQPFDITQHLEFWMKDLVAMIELAESLNVTSEHRVAQKLYKACLEADLQPFPAADPHYLRLIRSIGGFPAVDGATWNASNFSWFNMSRHLLDYGAKGLIFEITSDSYPFEPLVHTPHLGFESILQRDNIADGVSFAFRLDRSRMRLYLQSFQLPQDKIASVISGVFAFYRDALTNAIKWNPYETWPQSASVFNLYVEKMDEVSKRHPEAVANYLAMKLLYSFDAKITDDNNQGYYCDGLLANSMPYLFNKLYMAAFLTEETKMGVKDLRKSLRRTLEETDWLDWESRKEVLLKESRFLSPISSVQNNMLTDRLIREMGRLEIVEDSYPATFINLQRLTVDVDRFSSRHSKELSNEIRSQRSLLMDVSYLVRLLPENYEDYWPSAMKFGAWGSLLGQEIIGYLNFSSKGAQPLFEERVKCFLDQYSRYLNLTSDILGQHLDEIATLQLAFAAYQSHNKQHNITEKMPELNLSADQLFFVQYAQSLYYNSKGQSNLQRNAILGALSSRAAFNCPVDPDLRHTAETCRLF